MNNQARRPSEQILRDVMAACTRLRDRGHWPATLEEIGQEAGCHYSTVFFARRALVEDQYLVLKFKGARGTDFGPKRFPKTRTA